MSLYIASYWIHVATVILSGGGFLLRGAWMLQGSDLLQRKFVRIAPHANDTVLLLSAIVLMVQTSAYPTSLNWLTVKLVALFIYIGLGVMALRGKSEEIRRAAFAAAILTFAYMVSVALTRDPLGVFSLAIRHLG